MKSEITAQNRCTYCGEVSDVLTQHLGTCQSESWTCTQCYGEHGGHIMQIQQDMQDTANAIMSGDLDDFVKVVELVEHWAKLLRNEDLPEYIEAMRVMGERETANNKGCKQ